jgi:AraC-like DNA-binding protein
MSQLTETVFNNINLFNGIVAAVCTVLHLVLKRKHAINYHIAFSYFLMACLLLYFWSFKAGIIYHAPFLIYADIAVTYAIGPSFYLYFRRLTDSSERFTLRSFCHFLPAIFCALFLAGNHIFSNKITQYFLANRPSVSQYGVFLSINIINTIADMSITTYLVLSIIRIYHAIKTGDHKFQKEFRYILFFFIAAIISTLFLLYGHYTGNDALIAVVSSIIGILVIYFFVISHRYPEITQRTITRTKDAGNEGFLPADIDADKLAERVMELIGNQRVYRSRNLTLQSMSNKLLVSSHTLSLILNNRMNMNFRTFVNYYRLKEAKTLLEMNPEMSILEIAYEVGFNSKTSFNTAFIRETGFAPREYRAQCLKKKYHGK